MLPSPIVLRHLIIDSTRYYSPQLKKRLMEKKPVDEWVAISLRALASLPQAIRRSLRRP
jgi:hypothetical protein